MRKTVSSESIIWLSSCIVVRAPLISASEKLSLSAFMYSWIAGIVSDWARSRWKSLKSKLLNSLSFSAVTMVTLPELACEVTVLWVVCRRVRFRAGWSWLAAVGADDSSSSSSSELSNCRLFFFWDCDWVVGFSAAFFWVVVSSSSSSSPASSSSSSSSSSLPVAFFRFFFSFSSTFLKQAKRIKSIAASASLASTLFERRDLACAVARRIRVSRVRAVIGCV